MKNVLMFISCSGCGVSSLLAEQALAFHQSARLSFTFVGDNREQYEGLFEKLSRGNVTMVSLAGLDDHTDFRKKAREISRIMERCKAEVIHVQTNWQLALVAWAKLAHGHECKVVYTIHAYRNTSLVKSLSARAVMGTALWLLADLVIMPSSFLLSQFPMLRRKAVVLPLGVDEAIMAQDRVHPRMSPPTLIFAGQFRRGKNQEWIIRALAEYIQRHKTRDVRLVLPGEGTCYERCRKLVEALGLGGLVVMPGACNREEILRYYGTATCAVVPSSSETFGHCIAEPFCLGIPVLSRPVGVAHDIIEHGKTGWFFRSRSELVGLLSEVLLKNDLLAGVSINSFRARQRFSWAQIRSSYEQFVDRPSI